MSSRKDKPPHDDPEQSKRFLEAAKELGADESKQGADRAFERIAKAKKQPRGADHK